MNEAPYCDAAKRCSKCGCVKPLTEFSPRSSGKCGYQSACKVCRKAAYSKSDSDRKKQRYADDTLFREKQRAWCRAAFDKNKQKYMEQRKRRYLDDRAVRVAAVARVDRWRELNPNRTRVYSAKKRARQAGASGGFTADDVDALIKQQDSKCIYCDGDISDGKHTIEHVVPLSRGGSNELSNIALACRSCNARKGDRLISEFLKGDNHG